MRAIVTIIDEKTGHVFEKDKILEPYREQRDPRFCSTEYEYRFKHSILDDYFKMIFDQQMVEPKVKVNACSECEFFNDSSCYNTDNSILATWGSCRKCQCNMVTTNPYHETPSWCPLKGDKDGI